MTSNINMKTACVLFLAILLGGCSRVDENAVNSPPKIEDKRAAELSKIKEAVVPFFKPMGVHEGDWLESFKESGETFDEYIGSDPTLPTDERKTIYIQPIGSFSPRQNEVLKLTAEYMRAFFNLPVILNPEKALGNVPKGMTRTRYPNSLQIRTGYFLEDVLPKMLPEDAAAFICFTNVDLYPDDTMNYVFGQASFENRVGVWSLWRFGNPKTGGADQRRLLLARTLKIAMHETGHMFSMRHCTKYECLMSGTNHLDETDRRPLDACPECMAKIAWAMKYDPVERYKNLAEFWRKQGWADEGKLFSRKTAAVRTASK